MRWEESFETCYWSNSVYFVCIWRLKIIAWLGYESFPELTGECGGSLVREKVFRFLQGKFELPAIDSTLWNSLHFPVPFLCFMIYGGITYVSFFEPLKYLLQDFVFKSISPYQESGHITLPCRFLILQFKISPFPPFVAWTEINSVQLWLFLQSCPSISLCISFPLHYFPKKCFVVRYLFTSCAFVGTQNTRNSKELQNILLVLFGFLALLWIDSYQHCRNSFVL